MPEQISTVIDALEGDWDFGAPVPPDDLARAAQMIGGLPPEVAALYVRTDGGSVGTVDLFTLDELTDANKRRPKGLAKATFFASDGADGFFFVDGGNALKHGATSIYWFERGTTVLKGAVRCAGSLAEFLRMLAAGQRPWSGPSLAAVNIDGMIAKLEATRDRWTGRAGATPKEIYDAGERVNVLIAKELRKLLAFADGLAIPAVGIVVRDAGSIDPVPGTTPPSGHPQALWFANDSQGNGYAVMTIGWRGADGGEVVRIAPGAAPADAPILGSLPAVMVAWLEGRKL